MLGSPALATGDLGGSYGLPSVADSCGEDRGAESHLVPGRVVGPGHAIPVSDQDAACADGEASDRNPSEAPSRRRRHLVPLAGGPGGGRSCAPGGARTLLEGVEGISLRAEW